jgi:DNA-binding MarR family transcriptional regulator
MNRDFKGVWIPKEIWISKELSLQEKVFYIEIESLCNAHGCFASNSYFCSFFDLSQSRVSAILSSLSKKGYIDIHINQMNNYKRTIIVKKTNKTPLTRTKFKKALPENEKRALIGSEERALIGSEEYNNININNTILKKIYKKVHFFKSKKFSRLWFEEFLPMKKRKKASISPRAQKTQLNKLIDYSNNDLRIAIEILTKSIDSGWSDIYPLKTNNTFQKGTHVTSSNKLDYSNLLIKKI